MGVVFYGVRYGTKGASDEESPVRRAGSVEEAHAASGDLLGYYSAVVIRAASGQLERVVVR